MQSVKDARSWFESVTKVITHPDTVKINKNCLYHAVFFSYVEAKFMVKSYADITAAKIDAPAASYDHSAHSGKDGLNTFIDLLNCFKEFVPHPTTNYSNSSGFILFDIRNKLVDFDLFCPQVLIGRSSSWDIPKLGFNYSLAKIERTTAELA